jgi:low temperature requirement protein LtrA
MLQDGGATASQPSEPRISRVSTLELFFDLVFVFAITQLTSLLAHPHDLSDYLKTVLVFMTMMWIYGGYAWLTSNTALDLPQQRLLLFAAMSGFFVMALSIPDVFDAGGLPYALGLLTVTIIHALLFKSAPTSGAQAIRRIAPFNLAVALLVLAAAFVRPPWDWPLWLAAVSVLLVATARRRERNFQVSPAHFVERNGLLLIVALGESVVAVGLGAEGLSIDATLVLAAVLALLLSASVWGAYFHENERRAEHAFMRTDPAERIRMALLGYGYTHFVMIFGIILLAAGLEVGIARPLGQPDTVGLWNVAGGLAVYLLGVMLFQRIMRIGAGRLPMLLAALAFATVPIGMRLGAAAQVASCGALMQMLWLSPRAWRGEAHQD